MAAWIARPEFSTAPDRRTSYGKPDWLLGTLGWRNVTWRAWHVLDTSCPRFPSVDGQNQLPARAFGCQVVTQLIPGGASDAPLSQCFA
jgi:hypothetical protein